MAYTYEDFEKKATDAGMMGQFSQYDLDLARQHPEFGLSILGLKQDYSNATTDEQKLLANEAANALRRSYGYYSGGRDGSQYISTGKWQPQVDDKIAQIGSFGAFDYKGERPTYNNAYAGQQQALLDSIINRPDFSWSKETDPQWASYKKSYLREGERATADALGQASAASGGRASSYAVNAATQAGDYYATKLNDVIPTLYQQAYDRYLKEFQMQQQALSAVNQQEQLDYNKYLTKLGQYNTDRNFDYQAYLDDFSRLQSQLGVLQGEDDRQYGRYQDSVSQAMQMQALEQQRQDAQKSFYQQQLDAILAAGGSPSADMIAGSGYANEYVQALENFYKQQTLASGSGGGRSSGRSSGSSGSGGSASMDYESLFKAAMESGNPQSFISNQYKNYGFTSSSGLYNDFKNWRESRSGGTGATDYWQWSSPSTWEKTGGGSGQGGIGSTTTKTSGTGQKMMTYTDSAVTGVKNTVHIGADGQKRVVVEGVGTLTLDELEKRVDRGQIIEDRDPVTGRYRYRMRGPDAEISPVRPEQSAR